MMSRLQSVITLIVTAAAVLTGTASHAADATFVCPGAVPVGQQLATEITVDVGTTPLGAYSVTVTYDPAVLTIASVAGGTTPEFSGSPTTNPGTFTNGTTNVAGFQTASLTRPTGVVSLARVTFNAVGPASTTVGLTVSGLFDTNSNPISVRATGCMATVTGGSSSSTTTTTSSSTTTIRGDTCPQRRGFWKNHPSAWPVSTLVLGAHTYTQSELLTVLRMPIARRAGADASLILARQLIAAKLNIAHGSDPTTIGATVADADRLLAAFAGKLPYGVRRSSPLGRSMVSDGDVLDRYNGRPHTPTCVQSPKGVE